MSWCAYTCVQSGLCMHVWLFDMGLCAWVTHVCIKWEVCVCLHIFVGSGMVCMN